MVELRSLVTRAERSVLVISFLSNVTANAALLPTKVHGVIADMPVLAAGRLLSLTTSNEQE